MAHSTPRANNQKAFTLEQELLTLLARLALVPTIDQDMRLKEDLGLDSIQLIEFTITVHQKFGIDLGRRCADLDFLPTTVRDVLFLLGIDDESHYFNQ